MLIVCLFLLFCVVCLVYGFFFERKWFWLRRLILPVCADSTNQKPKRMIFLSDIHFGKHYSAKMLKDIEQMVSSCQPDFILLGGDYVEEKTPFTDYQFTQSIKDFLHTLTTIAPTYAIMGNHDVETEANDVYVTNLLCQSNIRLLRNETVKLDAHLELCGLADAFHEVPLPTKRESTLEGTPPPYRIALMHEPDYLPLMQLDDSYDLILSGHAHKGQVTLFGFPFRRVGLGRKYVHGIYKLLSGATLLTSAGVGTVHIHARFFARPEIWQIDLVDDKLV